MSTTTPELVRSAESIDPVALELARIADLNDGVLNPHHVVDLARDAGSPLHNCFCWDDSEAAAKYRIIQAEALIRVRVVMLPEAKQETRAWVSLMPDRGKAGGYRHIVRVMSDDEKRGQLLEQAKRELAAFRKKYAILSELAGVWEAIDEIE